jgi:hypothetical protein
MEHDGHEIKVKDMKLPCKTLEDIKIPLHIDGDLALFLYNAVSILSQGMSEHGLMHMGLHAHTAPKLERFMEDVEERINPDKWKPE